MLLCLSIKFYIHSLYISIGFSPRSQDFGSTYKQNIELEVII